MGGLAAQIGTLAAEIVFPPACLLCRRKLLEPNDKRFWLCARCRNRLAPRPSYFFCPVCGGRLPTSDNFCHPQAHFVVAAPLSYGDVAVRELIKVLKYEKVKIAARFLADAIARNFPAAIENPVLVPIPLHPRRERKRGFNQSLAIARELSKTRGFFHERPVLENVLVKIRRTASQTKETRTERSQNVRGTCAVKSPERIAGKNVILIDDVFTTGATMREAARVLKESGAGEIIALAAARA